MSGKVYDQGSSPVVTPNGITRRVEVFLNPFNQRQGFNTDVVARDGSGVGAQLGIGASIGGTVEGSVIYRGASANYQDQGQRPWTSFPVDHDAHAVAPNVPSWDVFEVGGLFAWAANGANAGEAIQSGLQLSQEGDDVMRPVPNFGSGVCWNLAPGARGGGLLMCASDAIAAGRAEVQVPNVDVTHWQWLALRVVNGRVGAGARFQWWRNGALVRDVEAGVNYTPGAYRANAWSYAIRILNTGGSMGGNLPPRMYHRGLYVYCGPQGAGT